MPSLQDIRRRIRSVKNTQQVTKAMKMISAVKLRKSQDRLLSMRPYAAKLNEVVARVIARIDQAEPLPSSPLAQAFLQPREEKRVRIVVVAGDKGLCGGFNSYLLKAADYFLVEQSEAISHLDVVGKRASDWARKRSLKTSGEYSHVPLTGLLDVAKAIAEDAVAQFARGEIDALYVLYNHFNSAVSQVPTLTKVFPAAIVHKAEAGIEVGHLLEPDPSTVLGSLLPAYVETELLRTLVESSTSEHASRMAAMDKASSNAQEMIDKLTLNMNKVRQAAITNQIIEVVSGAAS